MPAAPRLVGHATPAPAVGRVATGLAAAGAMSHSSGIGELPTHQYVYVDSVFTHEEPQGFLPAVWYGLVAHPGRTWGCTLLLESGACYRNLPLHALATGPLPEPVWTAQDAQRWDCYGYDFSAVQYRYLAELDVEARTNGRVLPGRYLFSVAPLGDGFSQCPEQAKEFTFVALDNGRMTVQPTNHVRFHERSFTTAQPGAPWPRGLRRQAEVWSCE